MEFFERILNTPCTAGYTQNMTSVLKDELSSLFDKTEENVLGGISFTKNLSPDGFHLMLAAGIDTAGLAATYVDKSKVSVAPLGAFNTQSMAFSRVTFEKGQTGVLTPQNDGELPGELSSYNVEIYDEKEAQGVTLGDVAYFDEKIHNKNGYYTGFGSGAKMCICFLSKLVKELMNNTNFVKELGVGTLSAAFLGQNALGSRGASVEAYNLCPDKVINICPYDLSEKNVGKSDLSDSVFVKVSDAASVSDEEVNLLCEKLLDSFGISHTRRVSGKDRSALSRLTLTKQGAKGSEICLGVNYIGTRGETAKYPFTNC